MASQRLYRSRNAKVFGVCQGIADWKDLPADTLRLIVGISILVTGIFPGILIYAIVALILPLEPSRRMSDSQFEEEERYSKSPKDSLHETFEKLKRKVENMEESVFNKESDWDKRFHESDDRK
ncbi:MAG: PspC domain-containing protein [Spirochaetia bacterium]|nr:PspC domain-containing protein [Spirochaetia bacterium]